MPLNEVGTAAAVIVAEVQRLELGNENTDAFPDWLSFAITGATGVVETLGAAVEATTNGETEAGPLMVAEEALLFSITDALLSPEAVNGLLMVNVEVALLTIAAACALFVAGAAVELPIVARAGGMK